MIQLTRTGIVGKPSVTETEGLQRQFARHHALLLTNLFEKAIVDRLIEELRTARFQDRNDGAIARESWLRESATAAVLTFLLNNAAFLGLIERVTGCKPLTFWAGRVYRFNAGDDHYDSWHNDIDPSAKKLLAISVNVSSEPFAGGELVIRDYQSKEVLFEIANTGLGNAVIFRVDQSLEHRVSPVRGENPRTAFAGWFFDAAHFHTLMNPAAGTPAAGK